jgi:hypothetical protein
LLGFVLSSEFNCKKKNIDNFAFGAIIVGERSSASSFRMNFIVWENECLNLLDWMQLTAEF